jgi:HEAT repeat protein
MGQTLSRERGRPVQRFCAAATLGVTLLALGCGEVKPLTAGGKTVDHWVQALQSPDAKERKKAVSKLGNIGAADPAAVPALTAALKDADAGVRAEAALALLRIGPAAQEAVPALTDAAQNDRDAKVRASAAQALKKVQPGA